MNTHILSQNDWDFILQKFLDLLATSDLQPKDYILRRVVYYYALLGESFQSSKFLDLFSVQINNLELHSRLTCYQTIGDRLLSLPDLSNRSSIYFGFLYDFLSRVESQSFNSLFNSEDSYLSILNKLISLPDDILSKKSLDLYLKIFSTMSDSNKYDQYYVLANKLLDCNKESDALSIISLADNIIPPVDTSALSIDSLATNHIQIYLAKHAGNKDRLLYLFDYFFTNEPNYAIQSYLSLSLEIVDYFYSISDIESFDKLLSPILDYLFVKEEKGLWQSIPERNLAQKGSIPLIDYLFKWNCVSKVDSFKSFFKIDFFDDKLHYWDFRFFLVCNHLNVLSTDQLEKNIASLLTSFKNSFFEFYNQFQAGTDKNSTASTTYYTSSKKISNILTHSNKLLSPGLYTDIHSVLDDIISILSTDYNKALSENNNTKASSFLRFLHGLDVKSILVTYYNENNVTMFDLFFPLCLEKLSDYQPSLISFLKLNVPVGKPYQEAREKVFLSRNFTTTISSIQSLSIYAQINRDSIVKKLIRDLDAYFMKYEIDFSNGLNQWSVFNYGFSNSPTIDLSDDQQKLNLEDCIYLRLYFNYIEVLIESKQLESSNLLQFFKSTYSSLQSAKNVFFSYLLAKNGYTVLSKILLDNFYKSPVNIFWKIGNAYYPSSVTIKNSYRGNFDKIQVLRKLHKISEAKFALNTFFESNDNKNYLLKQLLPESIQLQDFSLSFKIIDKMIYAISKEMDRGSYIFTNYLELVRNHEKPDYCTEINWQKLKTYTLSRLQEQFDKVLDDFSNLSHLSQLGYLIQLYHNLGERMLAPKALAKLKSFYTILWDELPSEVTSKVPLITPNENLHPKEILRLRELLNYIPVLLPMGMNPVQYFRNKNNEDNNAIKNLNVLTRLILRLFDQFGMQDEIIKFTNIQNEMQKYFPQPMKEEHELENNINSYLNSNDFSKARDGVLELVTLKFQKPAKYVEYYNSIFNLLKKIENINLG